MKKILIVIGLCFAGKTYSQCWESVSSGGLASTALKTDSTLWAWGHNNYGQLGDGTNVDKNVPISILNSSKWKTICKSSGIKSDGSLWTWGPNMYGALGDGTTINKNFPVQVGTSTNWAVQVSNGSSCLALQIDGTLWAWGLNFSGELGDGTNTDKNTPTQIGSGSNWQTVSIGYAHSLGIKTDGTLWAWGYNNYGQLGIGTVSNMNVPTQVGTNNDWLAVSGGQKHSLALKTNGTLWAWGQAPVIGDGSTVDKHTPVQIGTDTDWIKICAGNDNSAALKSNGTLWAWGPNSFGQLGNGTNVTTINNYTPTQIGSDNDWQTISINGYTSLAIKTNNTLWAWGYNANGQVGDGTTTDRYSPVQISCIPAGINEKNRDVEEFSVYPNPAVSTLIITTSVTQKINYKVEDVTGNIIKQGAELNRTIDVSSLPNGVYFINLFTESKSLGCKRVVVLR